MKKIIGKIGDFIKNNKKIVLIVGACLVVLIIGVVIFLNLKGNKTIDDKKRMESRIAELAKTFYEEKYYPGLTNSSTNETMNDDEKKSFASKFKDTGITVDLDSLARLFENKEEIIKEFTNSKTGKVCDTKKTKVRIYPVNPFGVKDYKVEAELECGFEESDK